MGIITNNIKNKVKSDSDINAETTPLKVINCCYQSLKTKNTLN